MAHNHILSMLVLFLLLLGVVLSCVAVIWMFILFIMVLIFPKKREMLTLADNASTMTLRVAALIEIIGLILTIMLFHR